MESVDRASDDVVVEIRELLETAHFSIETARMVLDLGDSEQRSVDTLESRLRSRQRDEREASMVAVDAIGHARHVFVRLSQYFEDLECEALGCELRFWSTFEWAVSRVFTHTARTTSFRTLDDVLTEALQRIAGMQARLDLAYSPHATNATL